MLYNFSNGSNSYRFLNANVDLSMIEMNRILMKNNLMLIVVKS